MRFDDQRESDNIEDRRGQSSGGGLGRNPFGRSGIQIPMGGRRGGGLSFGTIIFLIVIYFVLKALGIDMLQVLGLDGRSEVLPGRLAGGARAGIDAVLATIAAVVAIEASQIDLRCGIALLGG